MSNERLIKQAREMAPSHEDYGYRQVEDTLCKMADALEAAETDMSAVKLKLAQASAAGSVLMQAMADASRRDWKSWATHWLKAADDKAAEAKVSDFVTARLNSKNDGERDD